MSDRSVLPWFQTYTGVRLYPLKVEAKDIHLQDIAHAAANDCRFGGHCLHFYSVAQHACLVHDHMPDRTHPHFIKLRLQAILHDSPEAYFRDMMKPLKLLLPDYQKLERRLERIILKKFGLPTKLFPEVKDADARALATEKRDLMFNGPRWECLDGVEPWPEEVIPWLPAAAKEQFLRRVNLAVKQYERVCKTSPYH